MVKKNLPTVKKIYPDLKIERIKNPNRLWAFPLFGGMVKIIILIPVFIFTLLKTSTYMSKMKAREYILLQQSSCKLKTKLQLLSWRSL